MLEPVTQPDWPLWEALLAWGPPQELPTPTARILEMAGHRAGFAARGAYSVP